MAYKSFAQRLAESFNPVVEKDEEVQNVDGIVDPKIATAFHDLVVGLIATDMSEAFAASSAAEQYTDLVEALQELHAQVCPGEELVFPGTEEDVPDGTMTKRSMNCLKQPGLKTSRTSSSTSPRALAKQSRHLQTAVT